MSNSVKEQLTETIVGSLSGLVGRTYDIIYDLYFTTGRVIAVIIRHPADIPPSSSSSWMSLIFGNLPEKRTEQIKQLNLSSRRRQASQDASPEELLAQNELNFDIAYADVASVEIKHDLLQWKLRFNLSEPSNMRRVDFTLSKTQLPEARRLLESVLKSKIKG
jgi:hypothetical protein